MVITCKKQQDILNSTVIRNNVYFYNENEFVINTIAKEVSIEESHLIWGLNPKLLDDDPTR